MIITKLGSPNFYLLQRLTRADNARNFESTGKQDTEAVHLHTQ